MKKFLIELDRFYVRKRRCKQKKNTEKNSSYSEYDAIRNEVLKYFQRIIPRIKTKEYNKKQELNLTVSEDFSVFSNPEFVLGSLGELTQLGLLKKIVSICIDQEKMSSHDLTSEVLIAQAALALRAEKSKKNKSLRFRGVFPENEDFSKLIKGIGIIDQVKSIRCLNKNVDKINVFKAKGKIERGDSIQSGDRKLSAQENFIIHMNDSLEMINKKLTERAENKLIEIIGELIGNAEDHSECDEAHWQFYGFTDENTKGEIFQQISIFNFGTSIADSIRASKSKSIVKKRVEPYINNHEGDVDSDVLHTIAALQENVSSKLDEQPDRGQGFTDLLLFFEDVANECANDPENHVQMSIISGSVTMYFDGTYLPTVNEDGRHLIFFNDKNCPEQQPDSDFVKKMNDITFPGTIITIKYRLREEDYELEEVL
ncbi:hypothetical protein [Pseudoalteromonas simplex]|uniref:hypothetical protein n=1 Tax=Pseudoalteromonas simplex TaxID=2783613 RepID=UPI0018895276|nr:hypothetical protein [Pseudoalteromonas sp. A520]